MGLKKSASPVAPFMTRAAFKQRIEQLVQLELAEASVGEWYDVQIALRKDMEAHASDALYKSIEPFVGIYMRDYDARLKMPELQAAQLAGIREWLSDYQTDED